MYDRAGDKFETGQHVTLFVHSTLQAVTWTKYCSHSGWQILFTTVKPNVTAKILLHLDGHLTHTNSTEAPQLARDSGIVIIMLAGHTMCSRANGCGVIETLELLIHSKYRKVVTSELGWVAMLLSYIYRKWDTVAAAIGVSWSTSRWPVHWSISRIQFLSCGEQLCGRHPGQAVTSCSGHKSSVFTHSHSSSHGKNITYSKRYVVFSNKKKHGWTIPAGNWNNLPSLAMGTSRDH